jgi:hypothetical protein
MLSAIGKAFFRLLSAQIRLDAVSHLQLNNDQQQFSQHETAVAFLIHLL